MEVAWSGQQIRDILAQSQQKRDIRVILHFTVYLIPLTQIPNASGEYSAASSPESTLSYGIILTLFGLSVLGTIFILSQIDYISPSVGFYGVIIGFAVIAIAATVLSFTSPAPSYFMGSVPSSRGWYPILALLVAVILAGLTVMIGWRRWPPDR